jgi:hypothetical protein
MVLLEDTLRRDDNVFYGQKGLDYSRSMERGGT